MRSHYLPHPLDYRWRGEIQDDAEARVALHTRASLVPAIIARTNELHSYDVPCVIALPISDGNADYLRWVEEMTQKASEHVDSRANAPTSE